MTYFSVYRKFSSKKNEFCVDLIVDAGMSLSCQISGLLVTTSSDKHLKVWDIQGSKPSLVLTRNLRQVT